MNLINGMTKLEHQRNKMLLSLISLYAEAPSKIAKDVEKNVRVYVTSLEMEILKLRTATES